MTAALYPSLYQVNTRVWLTKLSQALGRPARLDVRQPAELVLETVPGAVNIPLPQLRSRQGELR